MNARAKSQPLMAKVGGVAAAVAVAVGISLTAVAPASAAAPGCSSLGRASGGSISGSCTDPSFTIKWQCHFSPGVNSKRFYTAKQFPGLSFKFHACDSGVRAYWRG
jgi:hypothetical protein